MPHEFEVTVKGEIDRIYDLTSEYFTSLGYRVTRADRPNALSFTKGSWVFVIAIFSGGKRNLDVSMTPKDDKVVIHCTYKMPAFWIEFWIESADKAKLQREVEGLRNLANQSLKL